MKKKLLIILVIIVSFVLGALGGFKLSKSFIQAGSSLYLAAGHQYFKENKHMRAVAEFNKAIALDSNSVLAHISLGDAYFSNHNLDLALEEYEEALRLSHNAKEDKYLKERIVELKGSAK